MPQTALATKIHQALGAHADFTAQITFNDKFGNFVTQRVDLSLSLIHICPCSSAQRAVTSEPLRKAASTTSTPLLKPLIMRFLRGKL